MISEAVETLVDSPDGVPRNPVIGQTLVAMCSWTSASHRRRQSVY